MKTFVAILLTIFLAGRGAVAQSACTALGQTPETAFPVCGTAVFEQDSVPICTNANLIVPGCPGTSTVSYTDQNPFWYKFTCYQGGTLDFLIQPKNQEDDYDWQLYDVTGHDPKEVYNNTRLVVAGNWAGTLGNTGANPGGSTRTQCASDTASHEPSFAKSPNLVAGHHYLLLVSHYTNSQSGYSLSFKGGSAVIADTLAPGLDAALPACDGASLSVILNKKLSCSSLAADGSDFALTPAVAQIVGARSTDCAAGFDMDSLVLTFDKPLPPGNYTISAKTGSDHNTLLDNCGNAIPEGDRLNFIIQKIAPTPMSNIPATGCAPLSLRVVFDGLMRCNSIASNGSDFEITGPAPVVITRATGLNCTDNLTNTVELTLAHPIVTGGQYTLRLKSGTDGNTAISECGVGSPVAEDLHFLIKDTVNAAFTQDLQYQCKQVDLLFHHPGGNGVNSWQWTGGDNSAGNAPEFNYRDTTFKVQHIRLVVSNGVCSDTAATDIPLNTDYYIRAGFDVPAFVCPNDEAVFRDLSEGNITSYLWQFGNGQTSFLKNPPRQQYPEVVATRTYAVKQIVGNMLGCRDTAVRQLKVINNCFIAVPTAFTPNGDGMNDYLYPLNAYKARDLNFKVYNRFGQLVFETSDWTVKWDGSFQGKPQPMGSYVWMLTYINTDTNEKVFKKGATLLIR